MACGSSTPPPSVSAVTTSCPCWSSPWRARETSRGPCWVRRSGRWSPTGDEPPTAEPSRRYRSAPHDPRGSETMIEETMFEAEEKMDKAIEVLKEDFSGIRTGRANPGLFNKLMVDYYGAPTPPQQLASFQNPEPRTILVIPFDKSAMREIEKAIRDSDLGVNPSSDGSQIRCVMPELTEERRKEYIK